VLVHLALLALVVVGFRWSGEAGPLPRPRWCRQGRERRRNAEGDRAPQTAGTRARAAETKKQREQEERERKTADEKRRQEQAKISNRNARTRTSAGRGGREETQGRGAAGRGEEKEGRRGAAQVCESSLKEQLAREEKERTETRAKAEQAARAQSELARYEGLNPPEGRAQTGAAGRLDKAWSACALCASRRPRGDQRDGPRPSGSPAFDRSVENAVYKASPLPLPETRPV